ncbi:MAG: hypothetical protein NC117_05115 [Pseudoflavonifractor sp.]|nr:hypothetical protein [Pseudoflavonifractor sp.]
MRPSIIHPAILLSILSLVCGCSSIHPVRYADRAWHISDHYGHIIDADTTYRMTFGDVLIPKDMAIISCADSAARYPGMERFIADILHTVGLQDDEVLFYAPTHGKIFVRLINEPPSKRPSSLTANLPSLTIDSGNDRPYTLWIYDDDVEDWHRKPDEMYTYTYFDKKKQRILVVDFFDYGQTPIAQIFVYQSRDKMTDRMQLPTQKQLWDYSKHRLKDYERDVEFWSHQVEGHRQNAFSNYAIGQQQLKQRK